MNRFLSISEARARLPELVHVLSHEGGQIIMTVHGKPKAVVMNYDDLFHVLDFFDFGITPETLKKAEKSQRSDWSLSDFKKYHGLENTIHEKSSKRTQKA